MPSKLEFAWRLRIDDSGSVFKVVMRFVHFAVETPYIRAGGRNEDWSSLKICSLPGAYFKQRPYCAVSFISLKPMIVLQDDRSENWRIQAVSVSPNKFESRKALPVSWRGLEREKLSEESSIQGCEFVHMSGFIGANRTYEGALAMARASLIA